MKLLVLLLLIIQSSNLYPSINKLWDKETSYWGGVNSRQFTKSSDTLLIACGNDFGNLSNNYVIIFDTNNGDSLGVFGDTIAYDFIGNPSSHSSKVPLFYDGLKISIWDYNSKIKDTTLYLPINYMVDSIDIGSINYNSPNFLEQSYKLALIANKSLGHATGYNDSLNRGHVLVYNGSNWNQVSDIPLRSGAWVDQMKIVPGTDSVIVASVDKEYNNHFISLIDLKGDSIVFLKSVPLFNSRDDFVIDTLNRRLLWNPKILGDTIMSLNYDTRILDTLEVGFEAGATKISITKDSEIVFNRNQRHLKIIDPANYNTIDTLSDVGQLMLIYNNFIIMGKDNKMNLYKISKINNINTDSEINIYPNPNYGSILNISSNKLFKSIEIYNQIGKKINVKQDLLTRKLIIDSGTLKSGTYYLILDGEFVLPFVRV